MHLSSGDVLLLAEGSARPQGADNKEGEDVDAHAELALPPCC
jgi:hypothetical protein